MNPQDIAGKYPEAAVIVEMTRIAWNGYLKAARINLTLSDRLKTKARSGA